MPIASLRQVEKSYGVRTVLGGVNLTIMTGERVGLVGVNGSGKSTLARILAGMVAPDAGEVVHRRGAAIAYLEQEPRLAPGQTVLEAVLGGLGPWTTARDRYDAATRALEHAAPGADLEALIAEQAAAGAELERCGGWGRAAEAEAYLAQLGVRDPAAPTDHLSGGERRRVALATLLARRPDLAVLDEPTNHLDVAAIEWLEKHLAEHYPGAVLLITHDRYILDRVCTRTLEVDRGAVYSYDGGFAVYLEAKAERAALAQRTEANRQNFLRSELEWLRRQPKARTTKSRSRVERAEAELAKAPPPRDRAVELSLEASAPGKTILELRGLALDVAGRRLVRDLTLLLNPGERIGVVGPNGSGKTTLLRAITGELPPTAGEVVRGRNTALAYLDQNRSGLDDARTVYDNVVERRRGLDSAHPLDIARYLERFLFDSGAYAQKVGSLSGGERARVALAVLLSGAANLVLLDEPTNDLDVATLGAVEEMLLEFPGAAIVVTHDRWFLDRVATSLLAFEGDGKLVRYHGNYGDYLDKLAEARAQEAAAVKELPRAPGPKVQAEPRAARRGLTLPEKKELAGIMDKIEAAEAEVQALEARLADPAVYSGGGGEVPELLKKLEQARARAATLTARWEDLERRSAESSSD